MSALARVGRGVGATVLLLIAGALLLGGYMELGGLHGWNEGWRRVQQGSIARFGWVLVLGGFIMALFAVAALGKQWQYRWLAPPPVLFGVLFIGATMDSSMVTLRGVASLALAIGLGIVAWGGVVSGPSRS